MKCQVCGKKAHYGLEYKKPTHCKNDKSDDMINVAAKRCISSGCTTIANFGLESKKPTHCKDHKLDGMANVKAKRCLEPECIKIPTFGLVWKKPVYCIDHKSGTMVNVINKRCLEPECIKIPTFGLVWETPIYCKDHKLDGMNNVKAKRCLEPECIKIPTFGLVWKRPVYCVDHKLIEMVDVINKSCLNDRCIKQPSFGLKGTPPTHCYDHKLIEMIDVISKRCITCDSTTMNQKYKPNCARCHFYLYPNDPRIRNYKIKEHAFMMPLQEIYPGIILDKTISGGCSKRRPDGFIECLTHSIIIEIDEDQHVEYESLCDNRRTMELFQDLGKRPIIFIRLNPDSYKLKGKTIKGCFGMPKTGELKVSKKEFSDRFNTLQEAIESAIHGGPPMKEITSIKLYYSEQS